MITEVGVYAPFYGPYDSSVGPITPAPPSWSFNAQTRILSLSHASLSASELEFSYQNAAYQQYVAGLSVDAAAHPAGDWKGRVKAATGRNPSNVKSSDAIDAAPVQAGKYAPQDADFNYTSFSHPENGFNTLNPFYEFWFTTPSDTIALSQRSGLSDEPAFSTQCGVALSVNGGAFTVYPVPGGTGSNEYTTPSIALPGASGSTRLCCVRGGYVEGGGNFNASFRGTTLTGVTSTGLTVAKRPAKANAFFLVGDSISSGNRANSWHTKSAAPLLRDDTDLSTWDVVAHAWGNHADVQSLGNASTRADIVNATLAACAGRTRAIVMHVLDTNDEVQFNNSATDAAAAKAAYFDAVHQANPAIEIHALTLLYNTSGAGDAAKRKTFYDATVALTATRPWLHLYNGETLLVDADLQPDDHIHLVNSGHAKLAALYKQIILRTAIEIPSASSNVPLELANRQYLQHGYAMAPGTVTNQQAAFMLALLLRLDYLDAYNTFYVPVAQRSGNDPSEGLTVQLDKDNFTFRSQKADGSVDFFTFSRDGLFNQGVLTPIIVSFDGQNLKIVIGSSAVITRFIGQSLRGSVDGTRWGAMVYSDNGAKTGFGIEGGMKNISQFNRAATSDQELLNIAAANCALTPPQYNEAACVVYGIDMVTDQTASTFPNLADPDHPITITRFA